MRIELTVNGTAREADEAQLVTRASVLARYSWDDAARRTLAAIEGIVRT